MRPSAWRCTRACVQGGATANEEEEDEELDDEGVPRRQDDDNIEGNEVRARALLGTQRPWWREGV